MALDRTNMVSLFNIGRWLGGSEEKWIELGNGYSELTEEWGPEFTDTKYVNMKTSASSVNGYAFSMTPEREYLSDELQTAIDEAFKSFPTGSDAETYYARFYKTDVKASTVTGIKLPVVCAPSSTGGSAGEALVSSIEIHGNGDVSAATITIGEDGTYTVA